MSSLHLETIDLQRIQDLLDAAIKREVKKPDSDYQEVYKLTHLADVVDTHRRKQWNHEKFGAYDNLAEELFPDVDDSDMSDDRNFAADDMPF